MRTPQPNGVKGSLKWIQRLIGRHPAVLADAIRRTFEMPASWAIDWRSPRANDGWAEYRDSDFLNLLGCGHLTSQLGAFWPASGPQWDALGVSSDTGVVLVEAKAHVAELASSCQAKSPASLARITAAMAEAKQAYGVDAAADWLTGYYQYANRLAHLSFFQKHGVAAYLIFLYFVDDAETGGPKSVEEWKKANQTVHATLGLPALPPGACDVYIDVSRDPPVAA